MARLTYMAIASLDGYIADREGNFDWSAPSAEVHALVNDLERNTGTYLLGRGTYEVMRVWDTIEDADPVEMQFAEIWRSKDKIVYSTTLPEFSAPRTRLERTFDPDAVRALKESSRADLSIGGADLAAHAFRAGVVDEVRWFANPVVIGGGTAALPDDVRIDLELLDTRRFSNGVVYGRYGVR